jgi:hypothetical protein
VRLNTILLEAGKITYIERRLASHDASSSRRTIPTDFPFAPHRQTSWFGTAIDAGA